MKLHDLQKWENRFMAGLLAGLLTTLVGCGGEAVEVDSTAAGHSAVSGECGQDHPPFLTTPKEIVVEPGGATALVTEHGEETGRLSRIDLRSGGIRTVVSGLIEPEGLALLPGGKSALVLESFTASGADMNNRLLKIDLERCSISAVAEGFHHTEGIAVETDGGSALAVTHAFEGTLSRINLTTGEAIPVITDLAYPEGIAIEPDGKTAWITQGFTGEVNRVDLVAGMILVSFDDFHDPERIVLEPGGTTALVTDEHGELIRLNLTTGKTEKILEHLSKPQGLALEENGETVLVVEEEACSGAIARVDLRSHTKAWVVSGGGCQEERTNGDENNNNSDLFQGLPSDPFFPPAS